MSEEDKKLQKHLVDEMMKVYETNPDVMLYMQSLMENFATIVIVSSLLSICASIRYRVFLVIYISSAFCIISSDTF